MNDYNNVIAIKVKGNIRFAKAQCFDVFIMYDTEKEEFGEVVVSSHLSQVKHSSREWIDEVSYGICSYHCNLGDLSELAESIKDFEWTWTKFAVNDREHKKVDDSTKIKELKLMKGN